MDAVDWGSVPEWVGGIGTAAAFIVALALLARELAAARVNEVDRCTANEARRRGQASQVAAWIEETTTPARSKSLSRTPVHTPSLKPSTSSPKRTISSPIRHGRS